MGYVVVQLQGGLGNQLFQIAFGKAFSKRHNIKLKIDKSAFFFDINFNRYFQLKKMNLSSANFIDTVLLYINRFLYKILKKKILRFKNIIFINDSSNSKYEKKFFENKINKNDKVYIVGFFQSENYILNSDFLIKFYNQIRISKKTKGIIKKIKKNDVFIGLRFFEENKKLQNNFGGIESYNFYNKYIKFFTKKNMRNFFLMTSKKIEIKKFLPGNFSLIDQKNINDFEKLLIMSKFKNFIISNSSFFFWGYFFSKIIKNNPKVFYSKKFLNKNTFKN